MRLRSLAAVTTSLAMSLLLGAAALRCSLPATPLGPQPFATKVGLARGAFVSLPSGTLDEAALVASLREMNFTSVILETSAGEGGQAVADRVALAVALQRDLDADVFVGGYRADALNGKSMDALLEKDPTFTRCYAPDGPQLDADAPLIEKLRICSLDVDNAIAAELARVSASPRIGCYVAHQPELVATLAGDAKSRLHGFLADASSACAAAKRNVALSPIVTSSSGDAVSASFLFRDLLAGTGIDVLMLRDGAGGADASAPARAPAYYEQLQVLLFDQPDAAASVLVWANLDAFECDDPTCAKNHPATTARFTKQLCSARGRVDGIVATEYLRDLAERPLVTSDPDAGDAQAIAFDTSASAQLHRGYLEWVDAGAPCAR